MDAPAAPAGHVADATDCDDTAAAVSPGAPERCGNGVDDDCDGGPGECPPGGAIPVAAAVRLPGTEPEAGLGHALAAVTGTVPALAVGLPGAGATGEGGVLLLPLPLAAGPVGLATHPGVAGPDDQGALGTALVGGENGLCAGAPAAAGDVGAVLCFAVEGAAAPALLLEGRLAGRRAGDRFGSALASSEDSLFIGVPDDVGSARRGAVEAVPRGTTGAVDAAGGWRVVGTRPGDGFGTGLAAVDVDGDGLADAVVGAPLDGDGTVSLFLAPFSAGVAADADAALVADGGDRGLGQGVAAVGDLDADGHADLALSAPLGGAVLRVDADDWGAAPGPAAVLSVAAGRVAEVAAVTGAVGPAGDLDGDGRDELIAGGPQLFWGPVEGHHLAPEAPLQLVASDTDSGRAPPGWIGIGLAGGLARGPAFAVGGPTLEVDGAAAGELQLVGVDGR